MSIIFGRRGKTMKPAATGLQVQTSSNAVPVPIVWGQAKIAPNIVWYGDFKAKKVKAAGGKGGGKGAKTYKYSASILLGMCEGPIDDVNNIWRNLYSKSTPSLFFSQFGPAGAEFLGTYTQTPWSYLVTNHPTQALAYRGLAYIAVPNYDLGENPTVPQHNIEVNGILYETGVGGTVPDADPALLIEDFLLNENYGTPFPAASLDTTSLLSSVDAPTTGDNHYQTYCRAMGFSLSPALVDVQEASSILEHWLDLTNTACVWSGSLLKFIPYGDETISANGVVFVPDNPVRYSLTDEHFIYSEGEDPIQIERGDPADAKNSFYVEVEDRASGYELKPVPARDQASIEQLGLKIASTVVAHEIKSIAMGSVVAHLKLLRSAYVRNTYRLKLPPTFVLLEAMDIVTLTQETLSLDEYPVRIVEIVENEDGQLEVTAEDFPTGISSTTAVPSQESEADVINSDIAPGDVTVTAIVEVPADLTNGVPQVWFGAAGNPATSWGGCEVWISTDDASYYQIGVIENTCRIGELTAALAAYGGANPDNVNTAEVDLSTSEGELETATAAEAANFETLLWIDGEYLAYETATLTTTYNYDLTTLYRNLYGSTAGGGHIIGDTVLRLDDEVLKFNLPEAYVGVLLYVKFLSYNMWGQSTQALSDVTPVNFTPTGVAWTIAPPSSVTITPVPVTLPGGSTSITLQVSWTASPAELIDRYEIDVEVNGTGDWVPAPSASSTGLSTVFATGVQANTNYRARVRAVRTSGYQVQSTYATSASTSSGGTAASAPSAPSSLVATGGAGSAFLTWTESASNNVESYKIFAVNNHTDPFGSATVVGVVSGQTLSFLHGGLANGADWRYWVVASNSAGDSTEDGPQDITTNAAPGASINIQDGGTPVAAATTLNFIGGTITDQGGGLVDVQFAGGGGGSWSVLASHDFGATPQATFDHTGITTDEIMIIIIGLTATNSGFKQVLVSTNNGSSYYNSSGDYISLSTAGAQSNATDFLLTSAAATAARGGVLWLPQAGVANVPKIGIWGASSNMEPRFFVADNANPINAVRLQHSAAGDLTGGLVYILGR